MSASGNIEFEAEGRSQAPGLRLVVFGGIGAGKSTVTALLESHGAVVIEADRIGHEVLRAGHPVADIVGDRWPDVVVDGAIDRGKLASVVFSDATALAELESYTHPAIGGEIHQRAAAAGDLPVVVEVPLVARWFGPEWWWVAVTAEETARIDRTGARGDDRKDVERRIASQPSDDDYLAAADFVIVNDGGLADLADRVAEVWRQLNSA